MSFSLWKLQCDTENHTGNPFIHLSLLANVHCTEPLAWFKASGFPPLLMLGPPPLEYPVVALCHRDSEALGMQDEPLHMLQQIIDRVYGGVGQLITLALGRSWPEEAQPIFGIYVIVRCVTQSWGKIKSVILGEEPLSYTVQNVLGWEKVLLCSSDSPVWTARSSCLASLSASITVWIPEPARPSILLQHSPSFPKSCFKGQQS